MPAAGMQRANLHQSNNVNGDALAVTLGDGLDDGPDLFCDASLAADDLAHILRRNVKLQNGALAVLALRDRHGLGSSTSCFCHIEQEFLHRAVPLDQRTLAFSKSAFTVSGRLSAVLDPLLGLLGVDSDGGRLGQGIIGADLFDAAAVARAAESATMMR